MTGRFHHYSGFESLMGGMIHHSTGWGSLVANYWLLIAGNRGFLYREPPQALVAALEGTLGKLSRYIVDRGFSWREQGTG
jgi:hypothetical protein